MPRRRKPTCQRREDRFPHGRERTILESTASDDKSNAGTGSRDERLKSCLSHSLGAERMVEEDNSITWAIYSSFYIENPNSERNVTIAFIISMALAFGCVGILGSSYYETFPEWLQTLTFILIIAGAIGILAFGVIGFIGFISMWLISNRKSN
jgi:hypothetical protein